MKRIGVFLTSLLFILIPICTYAINPIGQSGLVFLDIAGGAQAAGMGEAFVVVGDNADALFFNPAGIGKLEDKIDISVNVIDWIFNVSYNTACIVLNGGVWGNFGISLIAADYPPVAGTRVAATEEGYEDTGIIEASSFAFGFGYGRQITDKFTIGAKVKFASQHLGSSTVPVLDLFGDVTDVVEKENEVTAMAYDLGTIFYPGFKSLRFGVSITNFSGDVTYEQEGFQLPLTFTLGAAMDILDFIGEHPGRSFIVAVDALHPRAYTQRVHVGAEYTYEMLSVRAGYKFNYDEAGLTMGVGFNVEGVKIDYAYEDFGRLNMVNRVSLGMAF